MAKSNMQRLLCPITRTFCEGSSCALSVEANGNGGHRCGLVRRIDYNRQNGEKYTIFDYRGERW